MFFYLRRAFTYLYAFLPAFVFFSHIIAFTVDTQRRKKEEKEEAFLTWRQNVARCRRNLLPGAHFCMHRGEVRAHVKAKRERERERWGEGDGEREIKIKKKR